MIEFINKIKQFFKNIILRNKVKQLEEPKEEIVIKQDEKKKFFEMYEKVKPGQDPKPKTSHTLNPVPFIVYDPNGEHELKEGNFGLSNVAATVTQLLGVETPSVWDESMLKY